MKRLLASTAILVSASAPLMAQTAVSPFSQVFSEGDVYGTDLIGQPLYVGDAPMATGDIADAQMRGALEEVGEINDLLISQEGEVKAVLLDIGGFLGIGERTIAVAMEALRFLGDETDPEEVFVALSTTRENLEAASAFERVDLPGGITQTEAGTDAAGIETTAAGTGAPAVEPITAETAIESGNAEVSAAVNEPDEVLGIETEAPEVAAARVPAVEDPLRLTRPDVTIEGYETLEREALTAEMLTGAPVYGVGEEEIGEVSDLIVDASGQVAGAVIDVGGFLGIGERPVAISSEEMQIVRSEDGDVRVYMEASRERLGQRPAYEE